MWYWWLIGSGGYLGYTSTYSVQSYSIFGCRLCYTMTFGGYHIRVDTMAVAIISVLLGVIGLVRSSRRKKAEVAIK